MCGQSPQTSDNQAPAMDNLKAEGVSPGKQSKEDLHLEFLQSCEKYVPIFNKLPSFSYFVIEIPMDWYLSLAWFWWQIVKVSRVWYRHGKYRREVEGLSVPQINHICSVATWVCGKSSLTNHRRQRVDIGFGLQDSHRSKLLVCHNNLTPDVLSGNGVSQKHELRF